MHRSESTRSFACKIALASALALFTTQDSRAGLVGSYTIGTGSQTSFVQFEFANQNTYLYSVRHDGNLRGSDLLAIMASGQPGFFSYQVVSFGFGDALFGVTVGADSNGGFGTPPDYLDYWHYWTRNGEAQPWATSMIGFGDRVVSNGSWDGWVFNSDAPPSAIPAPAACAMLCLGAIGASRRGARRR